jgi:putative DNA modification/repair radical SAM protein
LNTADKLTILADAAKYDASCASSGGKKRNSRDGKGMGSTTGKRDLPRLYARWPLHRLLKILLTNSCIFDCHYCINRKSSNTRRARFTAREVVDLTLDFYGRNYIEGLFLSSGIIHSPDYTMEQIVEVARALRQDHDFRGYIHLKTIPDADPAGDQGGNVCRSRVDQRGTAHRCGPDPTGARQIGPRIERAMGEMTSAIDGHDARRRYRHAPALPRRAIDADDRGADGANDRDIVARAAGLYGRFDLRRVYYSAFSPIPDASAVLLRRPPLMREHRLYQSDWLMRFYGFAPEEAGAVADPATACCRWTLIPAGLGAATRDQFPVDVNRAPKEMLLRVPGLGPRAVQGIVSARRRALSLADVGRMTVSIKKLRPFIITADWRPTGLIDRADLRSLLAPPRASLNCRPEPWNGCGWRGPMMWMAGGGRRGPSARRVPPEGVVWQVGDGPGDLFAQRRRPIPSPTLRVPRDFMALAGSALLNADPERFALLYTLLCRVVAQPGLIRDRADRQMRRAHMLAKGVGRDIHKMRAFVRFRAVENRFVAWFEPEHHILRANARFLSTVSPTGAGRS